MLKSKLSGVVLALAVTLGAAVSSPVVAQDTACWNEQPTTSNGWAQYTTAPNMVIDTSKTYTAVISTSMGDITIELLDDQAPNTVNNFVCLARSGYYDFVLFHRIITGFMIQTGDPGGTGTGGPGYAFNDEIPGDDLNYDIGTVAMANSGANTNGSQFFIVQGANAAGLPKSYSIFGKVSAGMDVVDLIANLPVGPSRTGEMSVPIRTVGMISVTINEA